MPPTSQHQPDDSKLSTSQAVAQSEPNAGALQSQVSSFSKLQQACLLCALTVFDFAHEHLELHSNLVCRYAVDIELG